MPEVMYRIHESIVEDTAAYRHEVEKFIAGDTSPVAFRAIRVPMGIYEQRESGTYMVRVRGAAGIFLAHHAMRIAELSEQFGSGVCHVTTRQDIQIHRVLVEDTPTVLGKLLQVGLSSRGGGGNTVRNVSACPYSGVCEDEVFDVSPYSLALTEHLISNRANFNLPRKFKVAFSGCSTDCGLASVADCGFFAHERDGVRGFSVYAGGGMGAHSTLAVQIEEFIPAESVFEVAEAVKRLFDKHGDRINRHRARLRFVLERVGQEEFRRLYQDELEQVRREAISFPKIRFVQDETQWIDAPEVEEPLDQSFLEWKAKHAVEQKQSGRYIVRVPLTLGDIAAGSLYALAELVESSADGTLRTTQDQDLQLRGVLGSKLLEVFGALGAIDPRLVKTSTVKTVACAGASTCKLGLCLSRGLAEAIDAELSAVEMPFDTPIRVSGCPNSCGQHPTAPIGLYGSAMRVNGRLAPFYAVVTGGRVAEGNARLAEFMTRVPARNIPALLRDFWTAAADNRWDGESLEDLISRWGADYISELGKKYENVPPYEEAPEFYRDFGSDEDFSLAGRGPGECGAGVMDVIAVDIDEAKSALAENSLYDAVIAAARALLVTRGLEPKKDREVFAAFSEHLITPGWVDPKAQTLLDAAVDFKLGEEDALTGLKDDVAALVDRVDKLYRSLDSSLSFRIDPIREALPSEPLPSVGSPADELDLRGVQCPMNFVRAKLHLEELEAGQVVDILLDDGEPIKNVPASIAEQGEEVLSISNENSHFRVKVRKSG